MNEKLRLDFLILQSLYEATEPLTGYEMLKAAQQFGPFSSSVAWVNRLTELVKKGYVTKVNIVTFKTPKYSLAQKGRSYLAVLWPSVQRSSANVASLITLNGYLVDLRKLGSSILMFAVLAITSQTAFMEGVWAYIHMYALGLPGTVFLLTALRKVKRGEYRIYTETMTRVWVEGVINAMAAMLYSIMIVTLGAAIFTAL